MENFKKIEQVIKNHGVIAFPTETVMGLGVAFDDEMAYNKLNYVKNRPEDKPYTMMLYDKNDIQKYAYIDYKSQKIIAAFMPGPITLLLPAKEGLPFWVTHGGNIIGLRVPDFDVALNVCKAAKKPLLVPSANKSGEKPAMTYQEVKAIFNDEIDYLVESDALGGLPSTIVDLTGDNYKIIRKGPISEEMIDQILGANKK